jgi:hypothetical protein
VVALVVVVFLVAEAAAAVAVVGNKYLKAHNPRNFSNKLNNSYKKPSITCLVHPTYVKIAALLKWTNVLLCLK